MAQPMTLTLVGALALAGVGAGLQLGYAAIGEINPIYYEKPPTRFHADLSPNRPSGTVPELRLARADDPALGTGCIGCRTYPEEYYPIHDASLDRYASGYAADAQLAVAEPASAPEHDPETLRLRSDIERVERYASGSGAQPAVVYSAAEVEPQGEEVAVVD